MANENRLAVGAHQGHTPHMIVPAAVSNAQTAHAVEATPPAPGAPLPTAAHDQAGNAAVVKAVKRGLPVMLMPTKPS